MRQIFRKKTQTFLTPWYAHVSSTGHWGCQDNFKPVYFFSKRLLTQKKYQTQQKRFLPLRSLCAQKTAAFVVFCSLIFVLLVCFCFWVSLLFFYLLFFVLLVYFCLWVFFSVWNLFVQKEKVNSFEIVLIASITYTTNIYPYRPTYWAYIYTHLSLFVTIYENLFYQNLFKSLNLFFYENSFWIFFIGKNLFFLWKSFESFSVVRMSFFNESFSHFFFLSLYGNKPAYECHLLKQIFCHQNMIKIFCWFPMSQVYDSWIEFFSFCFPLFSC